MTLHQPQTGYSYNSDSLFLHDFINSFKPKGKVLDVGAGCGIVGLLVARDNPNVTLEAVEKQNVFIKYAKKNAEDNGIEYKLYESDFIDLNEDVKYDYIISNPPYYPKGTKMSEDEILLNARYSSNLPLDDFFKKVSRLLKPHSHFVFCYDPVVFGDICIALQKVKMRAVDVRFVHSKVDKSASLVMIHARNGSKSMMKVLPPLITFDSDEITKETQKIYDKSNTKSLKCQL
jgi:tRNA1(Val) A37 N6-methylase TrmN6